MIQTIGDVPENDARRALNMGVGLILIVPSDEADALLKYLKKMHEKAFVVGEVVR